MPGPDVKDARPGSPSAREAGPAAQAPSLSVREAREGPRSPRIPLATPEVAASSVESRAGRWRRGRGQQGRAKGRGGAGVGGEGSTSGRRPFPSPRDASNQFPSFPKGPVLAHLPELAKQRGGARGGALGRAQGRRRAAPGTLGAPAPRRPSGARTRTPSAPVREGEDGRFCCSIKALCCAHTKAAKTRFCSRPLGRIEGTQLSFQMAGEACRGGSNSGEGKSRPPALGYPNLCHYPSARRGAGGCRSFVREEGRKEENLLSPSRPKAGIKHSHSCRVSPLNQGRNLIWRKKKKSLDTPKRKKERKKIPTIAT